MTAQRKTPDLKGLNALERYLALHPFPWKRNPKFRDQIVDANGSFVGDDMYLATAIIEYEAHHALKCRIDSAIDQFERDIDRDNPEYQP